jgi:hypothetical protein
MCCGPDLFAKATFYGGRLRIQPFRPSKSVQDTR